MLVLGSGFLKSRFNRTASETIFFLDQLKGIDDKDLRNKLDVVLNKLPRNPSIMNLSELDSDQVKAIVTDLLELIHSVTQKYNT
jgi:hypothetical protein